MGCIVLQGRAVILIDNFAEAIAAADALSATHWEAQAFTTSTDFFDVTNIAVRDSAESSPIYVAQLWNGRPDTGTKIADFSLVSDVGGIVTFSPNTTAQLSPSTTYFFVVGLSSGSAAWDYPSTFGLVGSGTFPPSPSDGWIYTDNANAPSPTWSGAGGYLPQYISVNGSVVPEPAGYALVASLGLIGFAAYRRFKKI